MKQVPSGHKRLVQRFAALALLAAAVAVLNVVETPADQQEQQTQPVTTPQPADASNRDDPLPVERTNCVRCHLTAGRELTVPVRDFARSVHDRAKMSCDDCHGGNTNSDETAHEGESGFIGTKLSAHMAACAECHSDEAAALKKGPHFWDLSKRVNRDYPSCIDCHGNHDVGKPPAEFSVTNVCTDCHKKFADDYPAVAAIIAENDRLWKVLREVHAKNATAADPTPREFRRELSAIRRATARLIHPAGRLSTQQAEMLNARVERLRKSLESWRGREQ